MKMIKLTDEERQIIATAISEKRYDCLSQPLGRVWPQLADAAVLAFEAILRDRGLVIVPRIPTKAMASYEAEQ